MGLLGDMFGGLRMKHPVRGTAQVVSCTAHHGDGVMQNCRMQLVVQAEGVPAKAVEHSGLVHRKRWPSPGLTVPVTVDRANPERLKVEWDEIESSHDRAEAAAEGLAASLRDELREQGALRDAGAALLLGKLEGGSSGAHDPLATATESAQAQTPSCVLSPAKTEGPYFVEERLNRSDIRDGQAGMKLTLSLVVVNVDAGCAPVPGAVVDIWHANAGGTYSDVAQNGTVGQKYLRGLLVTDANGLARFTTIYPGWYQGRAVHIHFKVRLFTGARETYEFTSQLFFDPATTNAVYATGAYAARGTPSTSNSSDGIYGADGSRLVVPLRSDGSGGLAGAFTAGLTGLPAGAGGGTTENDVDASILSTRFRRTKTGRRILRVKLDVNETVTVKASLSRGDRTIARRRRKGVPKGTRRVDLPIPARTKGGKARLTVAMRDATGKLKVRRRTITVPKRTL